MAVKTARENNHDNYHPFEFHPWCPNVLKARGANTFVLKYLSALGAQIFLCAQTLYSMIGDVVIKK